MCIMCIHIHTHIIYIYIWMVRRLAFPAPPPQWYGSGTGSLELLEKRPGVTDKASIVRKPYARHKSYNAAQ